MIIKQSSKERRVKIRRRIRARVKGSSSRPRLSVFRSQRHIYVQAVDDVGGVTLAAASSRDREFQGRHPRGSDREAAKIVGQLAAARLKEKGIERCVFDRGGWRYCGRVKALAEAIRASGVAI